MGGARGTHSLLQKLCNVAFWVYRHTRTQLLGLKPVSQDTILKHSESVLLTPTVREKDERMVTGICTVCPVFRMDLNQHSASFLHALLLPSPHWLFDWISPSPFYYCPDLSSVNRHFFLTQAVERVSDWLRWQEGGSSSRTDPKMQDIAACQSLSACAYVRLFMWLRVWLCVCVSDEALVWH